ncbi:hypothetical protein SDC9_167477 [bioreactor metagenome]|uniref:Uncharacterized protein n=1 Tax=bioreactor metagenome TaxID=1076179 RepID=A0A645G2H4_9ZZZZ
MGVRSRHPLPGLVGSQIGGDQSRTSGGGQIACEGLHPIAVDQIPVDHHHRRGTGCGHCLHRGEQIVGVHSAFESLGGGVLDDQPVHHRVRIGHADLDQVDAHAIGAFHQGAHSRKRTGHGRVADRQVADQSGAPFVLGGLQYQTRDAEPGIEHVRTSCVHFRAPVE